MSALPIYPNMVFTGDFHSPTRNDEQLYLLKLPAASFGECAHSGIQQSLRLCLGL